jgi:hypothetical protein
MANLEEGLGLGVGEEGLPVRPLVLEETLEQQQAEETE